MQRRLSIIDTCLILLALVGSVYLCEIGATIWHAIGTRNWTAVRAQITHVAIYKKQERPHPFRYRRFGRLPDLLENVLPPYFNDSRTLDCVYSYVYGGARFRGSRISIFPQSKGKLYIHLKAAHDVGKEISCYVNLDNPSEAVLYRGPSWHSIMNDLLCMVVYFGLPATWFGWKLYRHRRQQQDAP